VGSPEPTHYLSTRQAADQIGLNVAVIRRAIGDGELVATKPRGRLRIEQSDFDAWLLANRVSVGRKSL
jgi:excisionase family DNA binding protein